MLFNSWSYLAFLLLTVPLYWSLKKPAHRSMLIAAASILFYSMWRWEFSLLIVFSAAVDFVCAAAIYRTDEQRLRKRYLLLSLSVNLGFLIFFKYTYFIAGNFENIAQFFGLSIPSPGLHIILPLGISFYTFQTISYTIDVYRGVTKPVTSFVTFLAYVTFWPQLIAGPVLRVSEVVPQLSKKASFSFDSFTYGCKLIITGLFLKVVLADSIAPMVDEAFAVSANNLGALDVWVATSLFGFQIYFDFAGYSSIAIGSAKLLGLNFPDNFNWPYLARNPKEFWARWHISLSAWIRDYLYLPLTGEAFQTKSTGGISQATTGPMQQKGRTKALFITWFIMGLWHGAAWNFALWGMYHAGLIQAYRKVKILKHLSERNSFLAWALMFLLAMAGWISFRAQSLSTALTMYATLCNPFAYSLSARELDWYSYLWASTITLAMLASWGLQRLPEKQDGISPLRIATSCAAQILMVVSIVTYMGTVNQFIYFQF